jgi:hypothetical protein
MSYFDKNNDFSLNLTEFFLPKSKTKKGLFEVDGNYFDEILSVKNQNAFGNGFNFFGNEQKQKAKQRKVKSIPRQRVQSSAEIRGLEGLALGIAKSRMTKITSNKMKELRDKRRNQNIQSSQNNQKTQNTTNNTDHGETE